MNIERRGQVYATVKKALFTLLRQHFSIEVSGGPVFEAQGDIVNHEYEITSNGHSIATVSKRWFTILETYGVAIAPSQDEVLLLAAAVCIDEMSDMDGSGSRGAPIGLYISAQCATLGWFCCICYVWGRRLRA